MRSAEPGFELDHTAITAGRLLGATRHEKCIAAHRPSLAVARFDRKGAPQTRQCFAHRPRSQRAAPELPCASASSGMNSAACCSSGSAALPWRISATLKFFQSIPARGCSPVTPAPLVPPLHAPPRLPARPAIRSPGDRPGLTRHTAPRQCRRARSNACICLPLPQGTDRFGPSRSLSAPGCHLSRDSVAARRQRSLERLEPGLEVPPLVESLAI